MANITNDGVRRLANAIIFQAVHDYQNGTPAEKREVMRFLNSDWCDMLLPRGLNGSGIKSRIKNINVPNREVW